ncbi:3,4-dihydroxyphenylacetate 2,3-dioxygenase [Enhydrobacter aerosaccus]|uniref:3,4-dihydroxyphenylacetate 2,3-dioxygenase n=1 Tax=Enhydrobacter aerosaccus TaxID=225324 RepID=A0A1T4KFX7_9HYPH|nr:extradiol ring-cleavage dioxygenase [Enhydrobacter aerosaccus]SJZ41310.1 3,4-dihydroxyphenylacetate 2,3-dioxygenase [Enhydrobacter aerosaccus]
MGEIVGAAIVSHHPGLVQPKEIRVRRGNGRDTDLIEGFDRVRAKIDEVKPDTLVLFDTHWITTGLHLVAGAAHYKGSYTSSELPFSMSRFAYDHRGAPELAALVEQVAQERKVGARNVTDETLPLQYPTLNVIHYLGRGEKVLSVGTCQTAQLRHFLQMGEVIGEAIRRSDARVVLLASGAMSHKFYDLDHVPPNPRVWHPDNVSDPENRALDMEVLDLWKEGRHDIVLHRFPELERAKYEGHGAHYAQMMGALGGGSCRARGIQLSEYENAAGTGNAHVWFEIQ